MENVTKLFTELAPKLEALAKSNAVVGPTTSVGDRHAIPLVELSLGLGGGGGGATDTRSGAAGKGSGGLAGGGFKATPVAVLVIDGGDLRLENLGR